LLQIKQDGEKSCDRKCNLANNIWEGKISTMGVRSTGRLV
jgi:hypothetical protein